jgi:hypothetical protein
MNREAQATKQAPMPTTAKTGALRGAKLCVVLLKRLSREPWLVVSFGFCDIPLVWNIGRLVVKSLFSLFQLLHYPLEECGHRYCETPRATTATTTSWWMRLGFAEGFNRFGMMQCQRVFPPNLVLGNSERELFMIPQPCKRAKVKNCKQIVHK